MAIECSHVLLSGGQEFIIRIGRTETMSVRETVKNVIQGAYKVVCLLMYLTHAVKHNSVKEIQLQTTKSIALPIFEPSEEI